MPIAAWYALAASPFALLLLVDGLRMLAQRRARRAMTAASLDHALTVRRLDAAKAEARDVIDQHLAETPLYVETCEAEAARIAAAELDDDLARMFGEAR